MGVDVGFYHCTRDPAGLVAVRLAAKAVAAGQRLLIVAESARLETLDRALWEADADSFLAHGIAGTDDDGLQPILLSDQAVPGNGARLLMLLEHGLPAAFDQFERVFHLFEEGGAAHARARLDWKAVGQREGVERSYWQQTERGGWARRGE